MMAGLRVTLFAILAANAFGARNSLLSSVQPLTNSQQEPTAVKWDPTSLSQKKLQDERFLDDDFVRDNNNPLEELEFPSVPSPPPANASGTASAAQIGVVKRSMLSSSAAGATIAAPEAKGEAKAEAKQEAKAEDKAAANASAAEASANATAPANTSAANTTENTTANASSNASSKPVTCVTKMDSRISAWFTETAPEGTPCVFGVDVRDEGSHCIYDGGQFGSNGFCFTRVDGSQWGSCNSECPLYGPAAVLGKKLDKVIKVVNRVEKKVNSTKSSSSLEQVTSHENSKALPLLQIKAGKQTPGAADANTSQIASAISKGSTEKGVVTIPLDSQLQISNPSKAQQTVSMLQLPQTAGVWNAEFTVNLDGQNNGKFTVEVHPDWAPKGAARFYELVQNGFFSDVRFFRVVSDFMAQFGINGNPAVMGKWRDANIPDDPAKESNHRGYVTFANAGPNTRSTQLFINFKDNAFLDSQGFPPIGKVTKGMDVVDALYSGYGEGAPSGNGPEQSLIQSEGNAYLSKDFPRLSYITSARVVP